MARRVDFNCDMGESFGSYKLGFDEEVIKYITSANVACGFHAGDPQWMQKTVRLAEEHGVAIGAHPSFPDLQGFGRRDMVVTPEEAKSDVTYQIGALMAFTKGKKLQHVKPHGAMYNMAASGGALAKAICEAVLEVDPEMILVVLAGTPWAEVAQEMGVRVAREAFADRALNPDGTLVSRSKPGSVIHDTNEVVERSIKMVTQGKATAINGEEIPLHAETLCLHGDTPGAVKLAAALRSKLEAAGVEIVPLSRLV
ncbi:MAG: LamB/YcsF family protein [Chloroflexi bacterium]|nr:LamB/YcsF family protein [Chloroflexota bacterium]